MIRPKKLMLNVKVERRVLRFVNDVVDRKNVMKRVSEVEEREGEVLSVWSLGKQQIREFGIVLTGGTHFFSGWDFWMYS
ncbi:hypothetical protein VNO80_03742 [Phaseolus coccineus]|uniref:Uncharacterized protein n=1 Tax=Phaseolus coccineus TaxID=3886 RepID=A0AAN9RRR8_PHACN